jgi:hypothetical protein
MSTRDPFPELAEAEDYLTSIGLPSDRERHGRLLDQLGYLVGFFELGSGTVPVELVQLAVDGGDVREAAGQR